MEFIYQYFVYKFSCMKLLNVYVLLLFFFFSEKDEVIISVCLQSAGYKVD